MSATPKAARTAVHALLAGVNGLDATRVLDHEPLPGGLPRPMGVSVSPAGITPTDWRLAVRAYVDTRSDIAAAQDNLDALVLACEQALEASPITYRTEWTYAFSDQLDAYVATAVLSVPREDF